MFDFEKRLDGLRKQTILCIGDLMLDDFVYGEVSRISPEAPAPVISVSREELVIGGAGNVARNIASLGARCIFLGVIGDDAAGKALKTAFASADGAISAHLIVDRTRATTRKLRFVSEHYSTHLLRADWETVRPVGAKVEAALIKRALAVLPRVGAVVLSDYAKGTLTPRVIHAVMSARQKTPQAGGGRSQRPRLFGLSRRHRHYAQSQGTRGRHTPAGRHCGATLRPPPLRCAAMSAPRRCWSR